MQRSKKTERVGIFPGAPFKTGIEIKQKEKLRARALHLSRALAKAISVDSDLLSSCSGLTVLT